MATSEWYSRYYYKLRNKTTGKKYIGQTVQEVGIYLGSGKYWKNHCKAHGGYNSENIEILYCEKFTTKESAEIFLANFERDNSKYWLSEEWANMIPESTCDSSFREYNKVIAKDPVIRKKQAETKRKNGSKSGMWNKKHTAESLSLMSQNRKGKGRQPKSPETKAKMAEARRLYWERKKSGY